MGNLALNFDVPDEVRFEAEGMTFSYLNGLLLHRVAYQRHYEESLAAGDVVAALEAAKSVRFLERLYAQALELLRLVAPRREGVAQ
jgi:hypothetical protein